MEIFAGTVFGIAFAYFLFIKEYDVLKAAVAAIIIGITATGLYVQGQKIIDNDEPGYTPEENNRIGKFGHDLFDAATKQITETLKP